MQLTIGHHQRSRLRKRALQGLRDSRLRKTATMLAFEWEFLLNPPYFEWHPQSHMSNGAGCKCDCREAPLPSFPHTWDLTGMTEPRGALPRKCLFIYSFIYPRGDYPLKFRAMFVDGISIVFGTGAPASNAEISARLKSITASWFGDQYGPSWLANLSAERKTSDLGNEIYATVLLASDESWNGICRILGFFAVRPRSRR
jgi:hypothetical protein